jgi:hypothetical protein
MDSPDRLIPQGNNAGGALQGKGAKGAKPHPRCNCHEFGETVARDEQYAIFKIQTLGYTVFYRGKNNPRSTPTMPDNLLELMPSFAKSAVFISHGIPLMNRTLGVLTFYSFALSGF